MSRGRFLCHNGIKTIVLQPTSHHMQIKTASWSEAVSSYQWIRCTGRGSCFRETVTCVPNRIGRWVFANSRRSVAATTLRRLFWYKVSVFLFAPGGFEKPIQSRPFRHLSHDYVFETAKTKPVRSFWQACFYCFLDFRKSYRVRDG